MASGGIAAAFSSDSFADRYEPLSKAIQRPPTTPCDQTAYTQHENTMKGRNTAHALQKGSRSGSWPEIVAIGKMLKQMQGPS